jgi:hypothetical protein
MEATMSQNLIKLRAFLLLVLIASAALAQKTTGDIKGTVLDPGDAAVPKATVTAKDMATGNSFETLSGADGAYLVPQSPAR